MAPFVLPEAPFGTKVLDRLIVLDVESRGGDTPHTILTFGNASGRLASAPFWPSEGPRLAGVTRGQAVDVTGTVGSYRGRRQLQVETLRVVPQQDVDWTALMPSVGGVDQYWRALDRWRAKLRAPRLAQTLGLFYDDPGFRSRYEQCPASIRGHHAALGGLLQHTWEVARIGLGMARTWPKADADLVLAGALLHDIGKIESYRWEGVFEMTVPGAVVGHVVLGALLLDRRVRTAIPPPCTEDELLLLQHLLLSHHGLLEFGAPVAPMTLEAELLHHADNASAKLTAMGEGLEEPENFSGTDPVSTRLLWHLDKRRLWRISPDWGRPGT
jgi:3'-5' exoribonuclease